MSPTEVLDSHGERSEATRVRTSRLWWRPMVLKVSVGQASVIGTMSPYGTRPSLTSAWKPLQMPSIRPSRFFSRSRTASVTAGARKNAVMNLAEPSGSSPPEKPPGIITIWLLLISSTNACVDSATAAGVRLLTISVVTSAPARSKAAAESYSQLLPGNTGITTCGLATEEPTYTVFFGAWKSMVSTVAPLSSPLERYGNTDSMPDSQASCTASRSSVSPAALNTYSEVVVPISPISTKLETAGSLASSDSSTMNEPYAGVNRSSTAMLLFRVTPMRLPSVILNRASAVAP